MSAICVLTPVVIASWPAISAAVGGVAAAMGFTLASSAPSAHSRETGGNRVETALPHSEILDESMRRGQEMVIERDGLTVRFARDERGQCSLCVSGEGKSKAELRAIGDDVAGRFVQQFAYHKLMTELKQSGCTVIDEEATVDEAIRLRVRVHHSMG
jgi:hypothetical protein